MKKLFFSVLITTTLIASLALAGQRKWPERPVRPERPIRPTKPVKPIKPITPIAPGYNYNQGREVHKYVGRSFGPRDILALRQFLSIGPAFNGRRVRSVTLRASTRAGMGRVRLLVNGHSVDTSHSVPTYITRVVLNPGSYNNTLGQDIRTLQLEFNGRFFVQDVTVTFEGSPYYDDDYNSSYPDLESFVGDYVYANQTKTLRIRQILNLNQSSIGRRVKWVMVKLRVEQGEARAALLINQNQSGYPATAYQGYSRTILLRPNGYSNELGKDIRTLQVAITSLGYRGRVYIETVGIKFDRNYSW
jgi:hypothetical protein